MNFFFGHFPLHEFFFFGHFPLHEFFLVFSPTPPPITFLMVRPLSVTIQKKAIEQYLQGRIKWGRQTFLDLGGLNSGGKFFQ